MGRMDNMIMEKIEEISDQPCKAIPLVLFGYGCAVAAFVGGFGLLAHVVCHAF